MFQNFSDHDWEKIQVDGTAFPTWIRDLTSEDEKMRTKALMLIEENSSYQGTVDPIVPNIIPFLAHIIRNSALADLEDLLDLLISYTVDAHPEFGSITFHNQVRNSNIEYHRARVDVLNQTYQAILREISAYQLMLNHFNYKVRTGAFYLLLLCLSGIPEINETLRNRLISEQSPEAFCSMVDYLVQLAHRYDEQIPQSKGLYQSCMQNPHSGLYDAYLQEQLEYLSAKMK